MEGYLGYITWWAGTWEPAGWRYCEGQTLQIAQNEALFSLLGTVYGGDGRSTFKLPDMRDPTVAGYPANDPGYHRGFSAACPMKYIICVEGIYPSTDY
ncbi:MAG: tail fiber protein [Candidatus Sericytochromatia bacterium]|nr:tail fiber protein [Candidatus Sericytochromatia bacterium]